MDSQEKERYERKLHKYRSALYYTLPGVFEMGSTKYFPDFYIHVKKMDMSTEIMTSTYLRFGDFPLYKEVKYTRTLMVDNNEIEEEGTGINYFTQREISLLLRRSYLYLLTGPDKYMESNFADSGVINEVDRLTYILDQGL